MTEHRKTAFSTGTSRSLQEPGVSRHFNMNFLGFLLLLIGISSAQDNRRRFWVQPEQDPPFYLSVRSRNESNPHTCGASLIDRRWAMTSRACLNHSDSDDASQLYLSRGDDEAADGDEAKRIGVESIHDGPDYDLNKGVGDIALLKLSEKAPLGGKINLVDYNTNDDCPQPGDVAEIIGGGQTDSEENGPGSNSPHFVNVTTGEECRTVYQSVREYGEISITAKHICTSPLEGGARRCNARGNAGSPVLSECDGRKTVVGIVSEAYGCAGPESPSVHTRVSAVSDWITYTIEEDCFNDARD